MFFFSSRRRHTRYWRDWSSTCALPILLDREQLRHGLAAVLLQREAQRPTYDVLFDLRWPLSDRPRPAEDDEPHGEADGAALEPQLDVPGAARAALPALLREPVLRLPPEADPDA